jgi:glycerophosphoryl diester phosphodiesterase
VEKESAVSARPLVIAHRGFSARYPENTLAAIEAAIDLGVDFVEIDVQETRDGRLVVFHDYRLDRLCRVRGRLRDKTLAQLQKLNPAIPALDAALRACRRRTRLLIEIKRADPRKVAGAIEAAGMVKDVIVFSLSVPLMRALGDVNPRIARFGLIARNLRSGIANLESVVEVEGIGLSRRLVTSRSVVERIHRRGWKLFVWTVNRQSEMQRLAGWGVDGLITNHPDRALSLTL